ncbi:MAG: hypothetical protein QOH67_842 [Hyphomicrobiales bacterium]|nr:hypothetical protein [Hyphomicrobiales bacterium]
MQELANHAPRSVPTMEDAQTYRQYAEDCLKLARSMPEQREKLIDMAATWQQLAERAEKKRKDGDGKPEK